MSVGFDVGGTFTDIVVAHSSGRIRVEKTLTSPHDPAIGVRRGIQAALERDGMTISEVAMGVHGTTLVSNAIIESRGVPTGVVTTRGFEDLLEIGGGTRYDLYDLRLPFRSPLVERRRRRGVDERVDHLGRVVRPLADDDVRSVLRELIDDGVRAVAVCFLHSYANPENEQRVAKVIHELDPSIAVSLSSDVAPELGEYERLSTTVANAYVMPVLDRYLDDLARCLTNGRLMLMGSNGGTLSVTTARRMPITMIESGPAAGALAAAEIGRRTERDRVISFDMGGTTAKVSLIDNGEPALVSEFEAGRIARFKPGSGIPLRVPVINLIEVGAGGGSIARIDQLGLLKVGPQSAGAVPGPACYGAGGTLPTVTDANLVLGYLAPDSLLGGEFPLDADAGLRAIVDHIATPLGLDSIRAAWGIHDLTNENMAAAMRTHVAERNRDARRYSIVAFGGAGPVHAAAVARKVGVPEVIVPLGAGVMSAIGLLTAPAAVDMVRSQPAPLDTLDLTAVAPTVKELKDRVERELLTVGVSHAEIRFELVVDMRYVGQAHEIEVPLAEIPDSPQQLRAAFEEAYATRYTMLNAGFPLEVLSWRVRGRGPRRSIDVTPSAPAPESAIREPINRRVWLATMERFDDVPVYQQGALTSHVVVTGPAIVEQRETTAVVGFGDSARVDEAGNLFITIRKGRRRAIC